MSYDYQKERPNVFTESGQKLFLAVRDHANAMIRIAGAVEMSKLLLPPGIGAASTWDSMACVDRLIELGELREVTSGVAGQDRVFVSAK